MRRTILFLFISMFSLSIIFGQTPSVFNPFAGISSPDKSKFKNGAWTEYKVKSDDKSESGRMKFSLVGEENCGGKKCHWFEIEMWNDNGDHNITKMLIKGDFSQEGNKTMSIITKSNDEPAYEFEFDVPKNTDSEKAKTEPEDKKPIDKNADVKFDEQTITVSAGTFKCKHIVAINKETNEKGEMWFSEKVPLIGIVRTKSKDMEMELLKYGTSGAKSAITETPKKINFKNMMNGLPKQEDGSKSDNKSDENVKDAIQNGLKSIFGK